MRRALRLPLAVVASLVALSVLLLAAPIFTDAFTDTATINLTSHSSSTTWAEQTGSAGDVVISSTNTARADTDGALTEYHVSALTATSQYDVEADYVVKTTILNHYYWIKGQASTTDGVWYGATYDTSDNSWKLTEATGGGATHTNGLPYAQALTNGVTYHLKLELRTSSQQLYVDGVVRSSATDATLNGVVGRAGLGYYAEGADTDTTGIHWDNFSVTDWTGRYTLTTLYVALGLQPMWVH